ncbi:hypothetical protein IC582_017712 [Cucumis melo]|uniref:Uncharacterized protein n=1 Tax=Cucumis melo TaxID=3656 RepID=A0A9I9CQS5_CUCME
MGDYDFTKEGLSVAVSKLPLLEHLEIESFIIVLDPETLRTIGRCGPLLKSLKLKDLCHMLGLFISSDEDALAIAQTMPKLHHLEIVGNRITNFGLHALLDSCSDLQSLDLRKCRYLDFEERLKKKCSERIKTLRLPADEPVNGSTFQWLTSGFPYNLPFP